MIVSAPNDVDRPDPYAAIRANAQLSVPYVAMNVLATVLACCGLFADSAAVVIGAMIVALLLGPITGVALSLVDADHRLLVGAFRSLLVGAVAVYGTGLVFGVVLRDLPVTTEILARTSPSILDLVVALAGGAAGAYASVSPRLSVGLVGVAIATALVPPLASSAILVARAEYQLGWRAFLLAFTNIVAIQFASSVVLFATRERRATDTAASTSRWLKRNASDTRCARGVGRGAERQTS